MKSEKDAEQTETESQVEPDPVIQEDNENEEADISYEEINDETIAFIQLLESFKVSIEVINKFLGKISKILYNQLLKSSFSHWFTNP